MAYTTWGVADAGYSEGLKLVFPSDMDGTPGYIKTVEDIIKGPSYDKNNQPIEDELTGTDLIKRVETTTY